MKLTNVFFLFLVCLLISTLPAGFSGAQGPDSTPTRTEIELFVPFNPGGLVVGLVPLEEVKGECISRAVTSAARPDAWRCMSDGGMIYDPCYQNSFAFDSPTLACPDTPSSGNVTLFTLTATLPESNAAEMPALTDALPWVLELENGITCGFVTGATGGIAGMRINYGCADSEIWLVGPIDRSEPLWQVFYYDTMRSTSLKQIGITRAWY